MNLTLHPRFAVPALLLSIYWVFIHYWCISPLPTTAYFNLVFILVGLFLWFGLFPWLGHYIYFDLYDSISSRFLEYFFMVLILVKIKKLPFSDQKTRGREHNSRGSTSIYWYLTISTLQSTIILLHYNGCRFPHLTNPCRFHRWAPRCVHYETFMYFHQPYTLWKLRHTYSFFSLLFCINITLTQISELTTLILKKNLKKFKI